MPRGDDWVVKGVVWRVFRALVRHASRAAVAVEMLTLLKSIIAPLLSTCSCVVAACALVEEATVNFTSALDSRGMSVA